MRKAQDVVERLGLSPHPEGGFYRETYRSGETFETDRGPRSASTAIYFLVPRDVFSALHRIRSDEAWHFHAGAPLRVVSIAEDGTRVDHVLGLADTQVPQAIVPAGAWFGAILEPDPTHDFALVGCTVSPGFDFADFELGTRADLLARFPQHAEIVGALTRG